MLDTLKKLLGMQSDIEKLEAEIVNLLDEAENMMQEDFDARVSELEGWLKDLG